ncbi:MAG: ATPase, T2SS/T4P/T4SS family [Candidatus Micrarchaeota archaeon]|nr:ATPase, T2SS/T4P/T4SS family [Candidatus Micrarchaeota archaeon]
MAWIGWKVLDTGQYKIPLQKLSNDEIAVIDEVCKEFSDTVKDEIIENGTAAKELVSKLLIQNLNRNGIKAEEDQLRYLADAAYLATYAFGPITYLLEDDNLEEIAVIGLDNPIFVFHREKGWLDTNVMFTEREALIDIINKMSRGIGRRITLQNPRLNAVLPDGSRLHATIEPVSDLELTIRKFKKSPLTIRELIRTGYSYDLLAFLWTVFQNDKNVIICGNTAAGKTTTLNALFSFVPANERIILLEETPEIMIPHKHQIKMKTNPQLGIEMKDLIEDSLRMRPDRVIIGEVRSKEEILAMIESMNAGQARGCYATMHAHSAKELVSRLRYNEVMPSDFNAIDLVIVQRRFLKFNGGGKVQETRKVVEVCELVESRGGIVIKHLFLYDPKKDTVVRTPAKSRIIEEIAFANGVDESKIYEEIARRSNYLKNIITKSRDIQQDIVSYSSGK